jgi:sulfur-oxidizing protein SoxZ
MSDVKPRIRLPRSASAGDVVEIKTLISHVMETGQRRDATGAVIPRHIINRFTCEYAGKLVIDVRLEPAISANPYLEFDAKIEGSGDFVFTWHDDDGTVYTQTEAFAVT